jgi:hypothetical protein
VSTREYRKPKAIVKGSVFAELSQAFQNLPLILTPEGLHCNEPLTLAQIAAAEKHIRGVGLRTTFSLNFLHGDLYNLIPDSYGAKIDFVRENFGEQYYKSLSVCGYVARGWLLRYRKQGLPWSFYKETASLPRTQQIALLASWLEDGWTMTDLRKALGKQYEDTRRAYALTMFRNTFASLQEFHQAIRELEVNVASSLPLSPDHSECQE